MNLPSALLPKKQSGLDVVFQPYSFVRNLTMSIATVTTKGQITIPKEIRDYLKLETGSKVEFVIDESGNVKIVPLNVPVEALSGVLHRPGMKTATVEEMEAAIAEGARDWT
jgi:AbrB family looped-hinge helix DNA binding protein